MGKDSIININSIEKKIEDILYFNDGLEKTLISISNDINYKNYRIKPEAIFGKTVVDLTVDSSGFVSCINRIDEYIREIKNINEKEIPSGYVDITNGGNITVPETEVITGSVISIGLETADDVAGEEIPLGDVDITNGSNTTGSVISTGILNIAGTAVITGENGEIIGTLGDGNYKFYDVKYDKDGNIIAVRISPDGEKEQWIYLEQNGKPVGGVIFGSVISTGILNITGKAVITGENGEIIGTLSDGNYKFYDVKYDKDGNVIAVRISPDGEEEQWIYLEQNGKPIGGVEFTGQDGIYIPNGDKVNVYDKEGNIIGILKADEYTVYDIKYDENGNPVMIRISPDGEEEQWIVLDNNGGLLFEYDNQKQYIFKNTKINIYDENGNVVEILTNGKFNVYEVIYDKYGNPTMIRITPNGEEEKWINISGKDEFISNYLFENSSSNIQLNQNMTLELYNRDKLLLGGILGLLTIATGITIYAKKKNKNTNDDTEEIVLEPGDYSVYDVKEDEEGNVTDILINNDSDEEYWVHL